MCFKVTRCAAHFSVIHLRPILSRSLISRRVGACSTGTGDLASCVQNRTISLSTTDLTGHSHTLYPTVLHVVLERYTMPTSWPNIGSISVIIQAECVFAGDFSLHIMSQTQRANCQNMKGSALSELGHKKNDV